MVRQNRGIVQASALSRWSGRHAMASGGAHGPTPCGIRRLTAAALAFARDARAGATSLVAVAITAMTVGGAALIVDQQWMVDQRDTLKSAAAAASSAASLEMARRSGETLTDEELKAALTPVARRYILLNLSSFAPKRYARANETLAVTLTIDRVRNSVSVTADADLGGTLFSRHLPLLGHYSGPERTRVSAETQCGSGIVEVVLAFDVTASMNGGIDRRGGDGAENHRMQVAIEAAKDLISTLKSCDTSDVAVGIVPWDKTVRVPSPETWTTNGWVDTSNFTRESAHADYEAWAGCLMDRTHSRSDPKTSAGLSLELPGDADGAFPAFMYPDSDRLDPAILDGLRDKVLTEFGEDGVIALGSGADTDDSEEEDSVGDDTDGSGSLDADEVRAAIMAAGDNSWGETTRGPNYHCTQVAMLPLSTSRASVDQMLDSLYDTDRPGNGLWGGVTASHLGMTWARRMLASSWRDVWGDTTHPVDTADGSSGEVTKAIVLLTDGLNGASSDLRGELPGELTVTFDDTEGALAFGCDPCKSGTRCVSRSRERPGCGTKSNVYASRFTAIGRFGGGRAEDGHSVSGQDFAYAATPADARTRLNRLLADSCSLAHEEGLDVYTVALSSDESLPTAWKNQLIACSGNSGTATTAERAQYHLLGTDRESLRGVFRDIGHRLVRLRRTS